jgi:hypothetical protein
VTAGPAPLSYEWLKNGQSLTNGGNVSGASSTSLTLTNVGASDAASYNVVLSNSIGFTTSSVATLTVLVPPAIEAQPQSAVVINGNCNLFSIGATGTEPMIYYWRFNSIQFGPGLSNFNACNAGSYSCVVSNWIGQDTSDVVSLTLTNAWPGHFDAISRLANGSVQLTMDGAPGTNYTLLWSRDWNTWSNLSTLPSTSGQFQYTDSSATNDHGRFYRLRLGP